MATKATAQNLPHFGIKINATRKGQTVTWPTADAGSESRTFKSIRRARRYMRAGEAG